MTDRTIYKLRGKIKAIVPNIIRQYARGLGDKAEFVDHQEGWNIVTDCQYMIFHVEEKPDMAVGDTIEMTITRL